MSELAMLPGVFKWCVLEIEKRTSGLMLVDALGRPSTDGAITGPCWELKYGVEFDPNDDEESQLAFIACGAWIEQYKSPGSKYVIQELFFYEIH